MNLRDDLINRTIDAEGGYVDHPDDSGGPTNFGITQAVARAHGYSDPMADMSKSVALIIYRKEYWAPIRGDSLAVLSTFVVREVYDTAVNTGVAQASGFLQRALNVLTEGALLADGIIGPRTLAALQSYMRARDEQTLVKALDCLQGAFYIELAERRVKDRAFVYGWLRNRVQFRE